MKHHWLSQMVRLCGNFKFLGTEPKQENQCHRVDLSAGEVVRQNDFWILFKKILFYVFLFN